MIDDGDGHPRRAMHERVFEPRVTSKLDTMHMDKWGVHGRGMALYSIAVNAEVRTRGRLGTRAWGPRCVVETDLGRASARRPTSPRSRRSSSTESGSLRRARPAATSCGPPASSRSSTAMTCTVYTRVGHRRGRHALRLRRTRRFPPPSRAFCPDASEALPVCKRLAVGGRSGRRSPRMARAARPGHVRALGAAYHGRVASRPWTACSSRIREPSALRRARVTAEPEGRREAASRGRGRRGDAARAASVRSEDDR